ncbi:hypothetical protein L249_2167 [Ophiocordyceps polyrhachis-furcata BCC 54312]|uniref:WSC domain-containing protein n=1 Tax=Ophiocordyceps polyrhachis-furcata BCC 54312 TaxID=1330021 RepID=A0A367LRV9_9HYPO|nr:hypothetical protein L249_2167 [Ophiocordyceps polyrhachis-furcata BCC 54312]
MKPHLLLSALVMATTTTTTTTEAKNQRTFAVLRFTNKQLTKGRMDPIRSPGKTGAHVHNILGGSGFSLTSDGHHLASSNCSTAKVKGDNSNYWFPSLYFKDPKTGKYEDVELFYANAYYFFEPTNDEIKPFPLGLSIVSGDIDTRSAPAAGAVTNLDASNGPINPVKWTCPRNGNVYDPPSWPAGSDGKLAGIGDPVNKGEGVGFPDVNCDGFASPLRADIHFPACYDPAVGLTDYKKNMVFPSAAADGKMDCPKGHIHVPHLFLEIYWNTPAFKDRWEQGKGSQPFVLSNGDATGFSLHADFMAGWDEKVLQHIIDTCDAGTAGMDKCPGLPYGLNQDDCTIPSAIDEKVDGVLDSLPGSNSIAGWAYGGGGGGGAEVVSSKPAAAQPSSSSAAYEPAPSSSSSVETPRYKLPVNGIIGASTESLPPPAATTTKEAVRYHVPTRGLPKHHYGNSTNSIASEATPSSSLINNPPAASSPAQQPTTTTTTSEACIIKTVTARETVTVTMESSQGPAEKAQVAAVMVNGGRPSFTNSTRSLNGYKYAGCFQDSQQQRALRDVIRADMGVGGGAAECIDYCRAAGHALAGTEYGGACYCGDALVDSSRLDEARCNMACEGGGRGVCRGSWALSVYSRHGQVVVNGTASSSPSSSPTATKGGTYKGRRRHFHDHVRRRLSPHH